MADQLRVLAAPDKFKGTATASQVADAIARAAEAAGAVVRTAPMSDGGDGLLDVFGGPDRVTTVTGPDGRAVEAGWRLDNGTAVIESARASGLTLAGGAERNDPLAATSRGTGELLDAAVRDGAQRVLVGLGGSASTDGGIPAVDALTRSTLQAIARGEVELVVCCDVRTLYLDAAVAFAPQKGGTAEQVLHLAGRLAGTRDELRARFGADVQAVPGSGAAGGLGGALIAIGGTVRSGFEVVAGEVGLDQLVSDSDLVITGEGRVDEQTFHGKVVGGVLELARSHAVPAAVIAGDVADGVVVPVPSVSLVERFGRDRAFRDALSCVERAAEEVLRTTVSRPRSD